MQPHRSAQEAANSSGKRMVGSILSRISPSLLAAEPIRLTSLAFLIALMPGSEPGLRTQGLATHQGMRPNCTVAAFPDRVICLLSGVPTISTAITLCFGSCPCESAFSTRVRSLSFQVHSMRVNSPCW